MMPGIGGDAYVCALFGTVAPPPEPSPGRQWEAIV